MVSRTGPKNRPICGLGWFDFAVLRFLAHSIHDEGETDNISPETDNIEPISDREEDDDDEEVRLLSVRAGKRRRSTISEDKNN